MNKKQVMGLVTMAVIVGGTIYCIKKYKDRLEHGEEISLEEARDIVERGRQSNDDNITDEHVKASIIKTGEELGLSSDEIEELVEQPRDPVDEDDYDFYDGLDYTRPLSEYITEEEKNMRFDPNSIQARDHFIKMELAELAPNTREYQIMKRLFDFQFEPFNDGDGILYDQLVYHRMEYFGENSKWNDNVSIADIITHYARLTDYNIGEGVGTWVIEFVHNTDFSDIASNQAYEEVIVRMNQHKFICARTGAYGIFGLDHEQIENARDIASNTVDGSVTYEIEFNEFLKSF